MSEKRHDYQSLGGVTNERGLRPWEEVAQIYSQRSGDRVTAKNALMIANRGLRKLARKLRKYVEGSNVSND